MKINQLQILSPEIFKKYSTSDRGRIAIIGNAGVDAYDNKWVHESDCVIRFNNFATRQDITHLQRRKRCDILFTHLDLHSQGVEPTDVVIGIPFPFKPDNIIKNLDKWYPDSNIHMVNPYWNYMMCQELGIESEGWKHPLPSLGTTCLWHLKRMGININFDIYVCGFNWYFDHSTNKMQNYPLNHQPRPKHFNHDYWIESSWIVNNLLPHEGWHFSPSCLAVLNKVKEAM